MPLPAGVKCKLSGVHLKVDGPKGALERDLSPEMAVTVSDTEVCVTRPSDKPDHRALHGLTRTLINNMVVGVTDGFQKTLEVNGIGLHLA